MRGVVAALAGAAFSIGGSLSSPAAAQLLPGGPSLQVSGEMGSVWTRESLLDSSRHDGGMTAGASAQFNFPVVGGIYTGLGASLLIGDMSATSNIQFLLPMDGIIGARFVPADSQRPLSVYAFGGPALAAVELNSGIYPGTELMMGWSIGAGAEVQLSQPWSVGLKYRHFEVDQQAPVTMRGDMVTLTVGYRFPIQPPR